MRLKVQGRHFKCTVSNKCPNVWRGIKIIPSLLLLSCKSPVFVKGNLHRKKNCRKVRFCRKYFLLEEVQKQVFVGVPAQIHGKISWENFSKRIELKPITSL